MDQEQGVAAGLVLLVVLVLTLVVLLFLIERTGIRITGLYLPYLFA